MPDESRNYHEQDERRGRPSTLVIDPVCGMTINPANAAGSHLHEGKPFFFCSTTCLERFRTTPSRI